MFNIFRDTIAKDLTKIADYFNGVADAGTIFKDKRALAVNRIKNAVLNGDIGGGGVTPEIEAEIENAQWKTESSTPLFSETVTANETPFGGMASFTYDEFINAETIIVTFDGVKYTCDRSFTSNDRRSYYYGATPAESEYDFSEYPFSISSVINEVGTLNSVVTQYPGEHTVSVSTESTTYTDAFKKGVAENSTFYVDFATSHGVGITANRTFGEILSAYNNGAVVIGRYSNRVYNISSVLEQLGGVNGINFSNIEYVPSDSVIDVKLITATPDGFNYYDTEISTTEPA